MASGDVSGGSAAGSSPGGPAAGGEAGADVAGAGDDGAFLSGALDGLAAAARETARELSGPAARYAGWVRETLEEGGRVLFCGNGGSAATAQHVAAEYVVRFRRRRRPLPAEALGASVPELTAAANDLGFAASFARAVEARAARGDLLVVHSTSGTSENVVRAVEAASERGIRSVALTGSRGGPLSRAADLCLAVPASDPARVQELHLAVEHAVVGRVEARVAGRDGEGGGADEDAAGRDDDGGRDGSGSQATGRKAIDGRRGR